MASIFNENNTIPSPYAATLSDCMGMFLNCQNSIMRQENTTGPTDLNNVFQALQPNSKKSFSGVSGDTSLFLSLLAPTACQDCRPGEG